MHSHLQVPLALEPDWFTLDRGTRDHGREAQHASRMRKFVQSCSNQGRGRTLDCAWDFFCGRMIHRKLTSHPVRKQPTSPAGGKIKIDGDSFVQFVSKMAIFFHRRLIF